jgi:hypothetical protein
MPEDEKPKKIPVAIQRLLDEVKQEKEEATEHTVYNRAITRHARSGGYNRHLSKHARS